jgi:predicted PurR-regulated permease PerM
MPEFNMSNPHLRRILYAVGTMCLIVVGLYTFRVVKDTVSIFLQVFSPFLVSMVVAYIAAPVVITLQRKFRFGRLATTAMIYFLFFVLVFIFLAFLIPIVLSELFNLLETLKQTIPVLLAHLAENRYYKIDENLLQAVQNHIAKTEIDYERLIGSLLPTLEKMASGGVHTAGEVALSLFSGVGWIVSFAVFLMFIGIINFYLILDWEHIGPLMRKMTPAKYRQQAADLLDKIDVAVGSFLRGQLLVALIVGTSFSAGLLLMGFFGFPALRSYCILIGTAAAIAGFIPYLGAIIGVTPALLIVLMTDGAGLNSKIIILVAVVTLFCIIQAVEGFLLQPKIVGREAGLHPLAVLLALVAGAQLGLAGMICAVPAAAVIRVLVREFFWEWNDARERA